MRSSTHLCILLLFPLFLALPCRRGLYTLASYARLRLGPSWSPLWLRLQLEAKGFRNPFRLAVIPGSGDVVIADVGLDNAESLKVVPNPADAAEGASMPNYGWPCIEGDEWIPEETAQ